MSDIDYRIKYHKYKSKYDNLIMQGGAAAAEDRQETYYESEKRVASGDIVYCNDLSFFGSIEQRETFPWHGIVLSNKAVEMVKNHLTKGSKIKAAIAAWKEAAGGHQPDANIKDLIAALELPVIAIGDVDRFYHLTEGMSRADKELLKVELPPRGDLEAPRTEYLATRPREKIVACIQGFDLRTNNLVLLGRKLNYRADLIVKANEKIQQEEFKLYRRPFKGEQAVKYPYFESPQFPFAKKTVHSGLRGQLFVTRQHAATIAASVEITWDLVREQALMPTWDGPRYGGKGEHLEVGSIVKKITEKNGGQMGQLGQVVSIERREIGHDHIPPYPDIGQPVVLRRTKQDDIKLYLHDPDDYEVIDPASKEALAFIAAIKSDGGQALLVDLPEPAELLFSFSKPGTLGLKLHPFGGKAGQDHPDGISLISINQGTQAEDFITKGLVPGLQLISVGGDSITQLSYKDVMALLRKGVRPVEIGFINTSAAMDHQREYLKAKSAKKKPPPSAAVQDVMAQARAAKAALQAAKAAQTTPAVPVALETVQVPLPQKPQPTAAAVSSATAAAAAALELVESPLSEAAPPHEQHIEQELGRFRTDFEEKLHNDTERISDELRTEVKQMQHKMNREIAQVSRKIETVREDLRREIGQVDAARSEDQSFMKSRLDELSTGLREEITLTSSRLHEHIQSLQMEIQTRAHDTSRLREEPVGVPTTGYGYSGTTGKSAEQKPDEHFRMKAQRYTGFEPHELTGTEPHQSRGRTLPGTELEQSRGRTLPGPQQQTKAPHINITPEGQKYLDSLTTAHEESLQFMLSNHEQELLAHEGTERAGSPYFSLVAEHASQLQALHAQHASNIAEIQEAFPQAESEQKKKVSGSEGHFGMKKAKRHAAEQEHHELAGTEPHELTGTETHQRKGRTLPGSAQAVADHTNPNITEFLDKIARPADHQQQIDSLASHHQKRLSALEGELRQQKASPTTASAELEAMKEDHRSEMEQTHAELNQELTDQVSRARSEQVAKMYDHNQRALESVQKTHEHTIKALQTRPGSGPGSGYDRDHNIEQVRQQEAKHAKEIHQMREHNTQDIETTSLQMSQLGEQHLAKEIDKVEASGTATVYTAPERPTQTYTETPAQQHSHFAAKKANAQTGLGASGEPTGPTRPTRTLGQRPETEPGASGIATVYTAPERTTRTLGQRPDAGLGASGEQALTGPARTLGQRPETEP